MRRHYIAGLVVVLLLAGCTAAPDGGTDGEESTRTTPNDGLTVQFEPVKSTFQENEVLQFRLSVANTGAAEASNIEASTFGSPFVDVSGRCPTPLVGDNGIIPSDIGAGEPPESTDSWQCVPPSAGTDYGGDTSGVNVGQQLIDLSTGATDSYDAGLEVAYDYSTNASSRVTVTTPSRISSPSPVTTENDAGPVKAEINMQSPQTVRSDGTMDIPVTVRNVGDGETIGGRFEGKDVKVTVTCPQCSGGDGSSQTERINLVDGRRQVVVSLDGFTLPEDADNLERSYPIDISLEYRYRERVSNRFTIGGQPGGVSLETLEQAQLPPADDGDAVDVDDGDEGDDREGETVTLTVGRNDDASADASEYSVLLRKNEGEPITATIRAGTGFSDQCDARATLDVAGGSATIHQDSRMEEISGTEDASGTVDISLSDWECREGGEEPFQLGCLPPDTASVELGSSEQERSVTCFSGGVTYDATILFGDSPVSEARVSYEGSGRKVAPAEDPPQFSFSGEEIGTTVPFTATELDGCADTSLDVVIGRSGGSTGVTCSTEAISRLSGDTVFAVDLVSGSVADPDIGTQYSVTAEKGTETVEEEGEERERTVLDVSVRDNEDLGCGTGNGAPQVRVNTRIEWDGKPWLWGGTLTIPTEEGGASLADVRCPDEPAVACLPIDEEIDPSEMETGASRTFTTTCFEGALPYDTNVFDGGTQVRGTVALGDTEKETGVNRGSVFEVGGPDSRWSVGDTVLFSVSFVEDCENDTAEVVIGSDGNTKELTCE